jgi:hypothetical protein
MYILRAKSKAASAPSKIHNTHDCNIHRHHMPCQMLRASAGPGCGQRSAGLGTVRGFGLEDIVVGAGEDGASVTTVLRDTLSSSVPVSAMPPCDREQR